jgi:DNA helicase-2/ATP-dependent DNA helicase PcrA
MDVSVLNEAQLNAMRDTEGAVLVLAGAGSGKTRVLTHRVAHIVSDLNVSPYEVLAITFTNKATEEMRNRLDLLLGEKNKVWISTFHSLGCSILRREVAGKLDGYDSNFSIYDERGSAKILGKAIKALNINDETLIDRAKNLISKAKDDCLPPDEYISVIDKAVKGAKQIIEIYRLYEEMMKQANAFDYDDLLYKTFLLLKNHPDVLEKYANRFKYIHVDEFQDTNFVQYKLIKMLAKVHGNVFAVGDDDQSIYGWRGAIIENILHFDKDFENTKTHRLLQNYRSTSKILDVANNVIQNNKRRHKKELFTTATGGVRVEYFSAYNDYQEVDYVVERIIDLKRFCDYTNKDFAVLVRNNSLTFLFEKAFKKFRLKYRVVGGFSFYNRKEVLDVLAYMRIVANPRDVEALERIINFPKRGIGETTVETLVAHAKENNKDLIEVVLGITNNGALKGAIVKKVEEFRNIVSDLYVNKGLPLTQFIEYLVKRVGFESYYLSTGKQEDEDRWDNIVRFIASIKDARENASEQTLSEFLQSVTLSSDTDDEVGEDIMLSTIHSAKGLEYKAVFVVCCEEDIIPSSKSREKGDIEEERRLMYVACTRARERLYITNSCNRYSYKWNRQMPVLQSRFVEESKGH